MNNFKKIGLTALAGSLIATSAFAGSMSVGGSAGISLSNATNYSKGNAFSSGDSLTFTGSGELDNGMSVVTYQLMQQLRRVTRRQTSSVPFLLSACLCTKSIFSSQRK